MPVRMTNTQARALGGRKGAGIFKDAWNWVKKKAPGAWKFVKENKLLSKGADALGIPTAGTALRAIGLGKKRRVRKGGAMPKVVKFN